MQTNTRTKLFRPLPFLAAAIAGFLLCGWNSTAQQVPAMAPIPASSAGSVPDAPQTPYVPSQHQLPVPGMDDNTGFVPIFDGKTLTGWDGDPKYWRVENGELVGEVTPETLLKINTFIIWRGGTTRDFELKADYRISAQGNSGINYRSVEVPGMPYVMRGYQADIDGEARNSTGIRYTGQNYEERGRLFLALRGEVTRIETGKIPEVIGSVGDTQQLASDIHGADDWNHYFLIVRGNVLIHILNGQVMSIVIDDDPVGRKMEGELGVQVHVGPPMKVEFKNILYKAL
ncbi:MAG: DUF1080 domain-containing protein [Candidatus Acidiferrales bacterium]